MSRDQICSLEHLLMVLEYIMSDPFPRRETLALCIQAILEMLYPTRALPSYEGHALDFLRDEARMLTVVALRARSRALKEIARFDQAAHLIDQQAA